jgi:hypothetical protein
MPGRLHQRPIRDMAQKYVPDQLQTIEDQLKAMKDNLANRDYRAVLISAPILTSGIASLKDAAEARKVDAETALAKAKDNWGPLSTEVAKIWDRSGAASTPWPRLVICPRVSPRRASRRQGRAWIPSG